MFWDIVILLGVIWVVLFRYRRRRMRELASRIPGSSDELPIIGVAHKAIGNTEDVMTFLKDMSYKAMENKGTVRIWLGPYLYFLCVDPVDLEMVLKTFLEKDDLHRFIWPVIGYGTIFAPVPIWRPRRKILVPAFSPKIVESFVPVFARQSLKLAVKLAKRTGENIFKSWPYLCSYTLDVVCESTLGVKINAQDDPKAPFLVEMINALHVIIVRICRLWLQPDWLFKFFPEHQQQETSLRVLHGFTDDIIMKRREELKAEQIESSSSKADREFDLSEYSSNTFLDLLIHFSGGAKGYSNLELREEVLMLTMAATDTTATALGYALKMMAKYPEIQDKVNQELDELFGDSDRLFEKEDLMQLKYLDRVIKETLRLFPPGPFVVRKIEEEISLPSGCVLPAGSGLIVAIWGAHRNPKYWGPDAEKFDPDRFSPERFNLEHPCAFLPFGNGPRNCVGYQYALMSLKTALSSVLRYNRVIGDVETSAIPQTRDKFEVMLKDVDGYEIAIERRRPVPHNL